MATTDLAPRTTWEGTTGAWLAQVASRTGSKRTPDEYRRYLARFLAMVGGDPTEATTAHVHAFAYGAGPHGREPSPSTVTVRLAAISSFYDFARRISLTPWWESGTGPSSLPPSLPAYAVKRSWD